MEGDQGAGAPSVEPQTGAVAPDNFSQLWTDFIGMLVSFFSFFQGGGRRLTSRSMGLTPLPPYSQRWLWFVTVRNGARTVWQQSAIKVFLSNIFEFFCTRSWFFGVFYNIFTVLVLFFHLFWKSELLCSRLQLLCVAESPDPIDLLTKCVGVTEVLIWSGLAPVDVNCVLTQACVCQGWCWVVGVVLSCPSDTRWETWLPARQFIQIYCSGGKCLQGLVRLLSFPPFNCRLKFI